MKATKFVKDKLKLSAALSYSFTDDTDPEARKAFEAMLADLCFDKQPREGNMRFLSLEYVDDIKNVRDDIKNWVKENTDKVGAGSTITVYYTKPERPYLKVRVYTFE